MRILQQFYNQKLDAGQSPSSVMTMHSVLDQALDYAVKERLIAINPCSGVSLPAKKKRAVQPLKLEQAQQLLEAAQGTMLEPLIALAVVVGMRHGELLSLHWQDIDFAHDRLSVRYTLTQAEDYQYVIGDPKVEKMENMFQKPF
jgi:integrase